MNYAQIFKLKQKTFSLILLTILIFSFFSIISKTKANAVSLSTNSFVTVTATYYGGEFNGNQWVIDNANQCDRIAGGEFSASSLNAIVDPACDDDNGLGYLNDIPLHNSVSFAELSVNAGNRDYSALGNLPAGTRVEIEYRGKCLVAEKRDVGTGGYGINGYPRALDFWWQTARSIGFTSGLDTVNVRLAGSLPLTPLGQTSACTTSSSQAPSNTTTESVAPKAQSPKATVKQKTSTTPTANTANPEETQQPPIALEHNSDTKSVSIINQNPNLKQLQANLAQPQINYLKFVVPFFIGAFLMLALMSNKVNKYFRKLKQSTK